VVKGLRDMALDPQGFVHVAEDGIARSYARQSILLRHAACLTRPQLTFLSANGTVIDYAPLSNEQLANMVASLPVASQSEKEHLADLFATANGFAVKDHHQIFHPSTQLRPAVDPARTHWQEDTSTAEADNTDVTFEERYVRCKPKRCSTGLECTGMGCDVCIIAHDMSARFCHHGDY
jgi:hypothetical protein